MGGSIPAGAGNTGSRRIRARSSTGHPRSRGEHAARAAWGGPGGRVIPACAGNTGPSLPAERSRPGHPRLRGEHMDPMANLEVPDGSSPLPRGTHFPISGLREKPAGPPPHRNGAAATCHCTRNLQSPSCIRARGIKTTPKPARRCAPSPHGSPGSRSAHTRRPASELEARPTGSGVTRRGGPAATDPRPSRGWRPSGPPPHERRSSADLDRAQRRPQLRAARRRRRHR